MNQKQVGALIFMAGGVVLLIGGLLSLFDSGPTQPPTDDPVAVSSAATSSASGATTSPSTATTAAPTTSAAPSTTAPAAETTATTEPTTTTTTIAETTTTTIAETTTTTIADSELIEAFIIEFAAALEAGDTDFVFSRLHPALVFGFGTESCRTWVETQIMGLGSYTQTGALVGPTNGSMSTPGGEAVFDVVYSAPVSFTFSGATFDSNADFVVEDGVAYFTGPCA